MKFSIAIGKLHCGAGFNTGQKQKTLSVPGRLWSMYIHSVEWNLTTGLLTVYNNLKASIITPARPLHCTSSLMATTVTLTVSAISLMDSRNTFKTSTIILTAYSSTLKPQNRSFRPSNECKKLSHGLHKHSQVSSSTLMASKCQILHSC